MTTPPDAREAVAKAIQEAWDKHGLHFGKLADAALSAMPASDAERVREMAAKLVETCGFDEIRSWRIRTALAARIRAIPIPPREPDPMREVYERGMAYEEKCAADDRAERLGLASGKIKPPAAPAKTEAEAIEAAAIIYHKAVIIELMGSLDGYITWEGYNTEDGQRHALNKMRAAVHAYNLARFGGDPGEKIEAQRRRADVIYDNLQEARSSAITLKTTIGMQSARIAQLEAANADLRELLKPYFAHWENEARGHSDRSSVWHTIHTPVTYEHHARARAALQPKEPQP